MAFVEGFNNDGKGNSLTQAGKKNLDIASRCCYAGSGDSAISKSIYKSDWAILQRCSL